MAVLWVARRRLTNNMAARRTAAYSVRCSLQTASCGMDCRRRKPSTSRRMAVVTATIRSARSSPTIGSHPKNTRAAALIFNRHGARWPVQAIASSRRRPKLSGLSRACVRRIHDASVQRHRCRLEYGLDLRKCRPQPRDHSARKRKSQRGAASP